MKYCFIAVMFALSAYSIKPNVFAYTLTAIDVARGTVRATLEKSTAMIQTKGKTSATSSSYTISKANSLVRIKISDAVFQSYSDKPTAFLGPESYISLYKLSSVKSSRSFTINTDGTTNPALIPVTFTPTYVQMNRITSTQGLIPGEYAFVDRSTTTTDGNITV
ncbi:MAG: hypothetical protein ABUT20_03145 [Bacteroidota bacterium]